MKGGEIPEGGRELLEVEEVADAARGAEDCGTDDEECDLSQYLREELAARTERRRFQLARDLLVAHTHKCGVFDIMACSVAVENADRLLSALAKPQEGGQ